MKQRLHAFNITTMDHPQKIVIKVSEEELKTGTPTSIIEAITALSKSGYLKDLRGVVSISIENHDKYLRSFPLSFWAMGLYVQFRHLAYFLDKESTALILFGMIDGSKYTEEMKENFMVKIVNDAIDFGVTSGYTKEEMLDYFKSIGRDTFKEIPNNPEREKNFLTGSKKKDFGTYLKSECGVQVGWPTIITSAFVVKNLVLFPNKISSVTVDIDGMLASFDFDDSILKIFIASLVKGKFIDGEDLKKKMHNQEDEPISLNFFDDLAIITNAVMTCELQEKETSMTTGEEFYPLFIKSVKIL